MNSMIKNKITDLDIKKVYLNSGIDWEIFRDKVIYVTGSSGVIGSFIIRCLLNANKQSDLNIKVVAAVRNVDTAMTFFNKKKTRTNIFELYKSDVINKLDYNGKVDYIIHAASNTSSASFIEKPVETFNVAVKGTENILNFAKEKSVESVVYLSSMEVYGNIDEPKPLKENELGNLNINEARSSYPIGKRAAESLCYFYAREYGVPVKVVRLAQVIGSNVAYDDTRVYAQFARSIVEKRDIVLNTTAQTTRSYCYITDVVAGILTVLTKGQNGECYNIANEESSYKICDIAKSLCEQYTSSKLIFDIKEATQYYKETHWVLANAKLKSLGWNAEVTLKEAYENLISSFYYQKNKLEKTEAKKTMLKIKKTRNYEKDTFLERVFSVKNKGMYKVVNVMGVKIKKNLTKSYKDLPIEENKIVFSNFIGNGYACNPKYIAEEIIRQNLPYELVWLVKDPSAEEITNEFPDNIRLVKYAYKTAMKELVTAKIWVDNQRKNAFIRRGLRKKEGQYYIQTWHGGLGFKKFDADLSEEITSKFIDDSQQDSKMIDYLLSNSEFENNVFRSAFWYDGDIIQVGHPRNDIFFNTVEELSKIKTKVYESLGIAPSEKILLYMPSFRDDFRLNCYMLDVEGLKSVLEEKFGGSWTILIRMHPTLQCISDALFGYDEGVVNASSYSDIQELLVAADVAMTDFSSCIFDFMLSRKPAFVFATDVEKFNIERGFYYPLKATPFPVAKSNQELIENIKNFDCAKYKQDVELFLKEKGCMEDGKASKRVVELIKELMQKR